MSETLERPQLSQRPVNPLITGPDHEITTASLADAFHKAIAHHLSLEPKAQRANAKAMNDRANHWMAKAAPSVAFPKSLLTKNAKLIKAEKGYAAGYNYAEQKPILMPDGRGMETTGIALAPAAGHGKFEVCPFRHPCQDTCLGTASGHMAARYTDFLKKTGAPNAGKLNSARRTNALFNDPEAFAVKAYEDIRKAKAKADRNGNHLGVRLNVLSDLHPSIWRPVMEAHPDVHFYDYTKMAYRPVTDNHHLTYSSTGISQPAGYNGVTEADAVHNPHQNWRKMRDHLDNGRNVAVVFSARDRNLLPREVHDEETGRRYRVIDGTTHDFRPLDAQPPGQPGVIVGLSNLKVSGKRELAHKDTNGFMWKYDPQEEREINPRTGLPGRIRRGESPGLTRSGASLPRPTFPTNFTVTVPVQPRGRMPLAAAERPERATGGAVYMPRTIDPELADQQFHNAHMYQDWDIDEHDAPPMHEWPDDLERREAERPVQLAALARIRAHMGRRS